MLPPLIRLSVRYLKLPRGFALLIAYLVVFIGTIGFAYFMTKSVVASIVELDPVGLVDNLRVSLLERVDANGQLVAFGVTVDMNSVLDSLQTSVGQGDGSAGIVIDAERVSSTSGPASAAFVQSSGS